MLHLLPREGRSLPWGTGKEHHGSPAALLPSPTRLRQHSDPQDLTDEATEQKKDSYTQRGKMYFSVIILSQ